VPLRDFLLQVVFRRSLRGWRTIRASRWEVVVVVLWTAVVVYVVVAMVSTAVDTECLWNHDGPKCNGGWFH
jgi:hypothetical protein